MAYEINGLDLIVYFSSTTEYTHKFVQKLDVESIRIPLRMKEEFPILDRDFLLICPTYGGGVGMSGTSGENSRPVPPQVRKFLSYDNNAHHMKAVIASGNINFGDDFCRAGEVISRRFGVPYVHRFELFGTSDDVDTVHDILENIRILDSR